MKLRIRDNSIRLRLMRGEVDALRETGLVTASTQFPGGRTFRYSLESSPASVNPAAFFSESEIIGEQVLVDGEKLSILVEKDFICLTGRDDEDESDMYPHPEADKASC